MDRYAWARWALPLSRCVWRKHWLHVCAAQFHNIGGGQFCLPLTLLRLHWTLIVKILQILLGNLQTPNLNCPVVRHDFFPFTREELVLSIPCMAKLLFKWIARMLFCSQGKFPCCLFICTAITPFGASASSTLAGCLIIFSLLYYLLFEARDRWTRFMTYVHTRKFR